MDQRNGQGSQEAPKKINVEVKLDFQQQIATFIEKDVNGLVMIDPKQITVPLQTILVIAAQVILAQMGVKPGDASIQKGQTGPRLQP